jgi:Zn-dependent peptidase ImmA (M78 family)
VSVRYARAQAEKLAERLGTGSVPVDVEKIADRLGLPVMYADLGEGVSGLLVSDGVQAHICVQDQDAPVRQRFTIAHEVGHHYLRHQFEPGHHVHVDRGHYISERGPRASDGVDPKEIEANQFAACLLMPSKLVREKVAELGGGPLLDQHVSHLARTFRVSEQAMTIRLSTLGLL